MKEAGKSKYHCLTLIMTSQSSRHWCNKDLILIISSSIFLFLISSYCKGQESWEEGQRRRRRRGSGVIIALWLPVTGSRLPGWGALVGCRSRVFQLLAWDGSTDAAATPTEAKWSRNRGPRMDSGNHTEAAELPKSSPTT